MLGGASVALPARGREGLSVQTGGRLEIVLSIGVYSSESFCFSSPWMVLACPALRDDSRREVRMHSLREYNRTHRRQRLLRQQQHHDGDNECEDICVHDACDT